MTRKQLAIEIYRLDEIKAKHKTTESEYVKRVLNGTGGVKGFTKEELQQMYNRRLTE